MQSDDDGRDDAKDTSKAPLTFSDHAVERMQQRGISKETVELVVRFGKSWQTHRGLAYRVPKKRREELVREGKITAQQSDRLDGIEIIVEDSCVVTVEHVTQRRRT